MAVSNEDYRQWLPVALPTPGVLQIEQASTQDDERVTCAAKNNQTSNQEAECERHELVEALSEAYNYLPSHAASLLVSLSSGEPTTPDKTASNGPQEIPDTRVLESVSEGITRMADYDWTRAADLAERRRIQNRIAQRHYRKKLEKLERRLLELEEKASVEDLPQLKSPQPSSPESKSNVGTGGTPKSNRCKDDPRLKFLWPDRKSSEVSYDMKKDPARHVSSRSPEMLPLSPPGSPIANTQQEEWEAILKLALEISSRPGAPLVAEQPVEWRPRTPFEIPSSFSREETSDLGLEALFSLQKRLWRSVNQFHILGNAERSALRPAYYRIMIEASTALTKLKKAMGEMSADYLKFAASLQDVNMVVQIGCSNIEAFMDGRFPTNIRDLYCMLHVSHAMSNLQGAITAKQSEEKFAKAAAKWRGCLPIISDDGLLEQSLFDEISSVMWEKLEREAKAVPQLQNRIPGDLGHPLHPNYARMDAWLNPELDEPEIYETNDPSNGFSVGGMFNLRGLKKHTSYSGNGKTINPEVLDSFCETENSAEDLLTPFTLVAPSWDSLVENFVIITASRFLGGPRGTGTTVAPASGSINMPLQHSSNGFQNPIPLDNTRRQHVLDVLQESITRTCGPLTADIFSTISGPFLKGLIETLRDLEDCMISLLKIHTTDYHSFEHFLTTIVSNFKYYYHTHLPGMFKCPADSYNLRDYAWQRIKEEMNKLNSDISTNNDAGLGLQGTPVRVNEDVPKGPGADCTRPKRKIDEALNVTSKSRKRSKIPKCETSGVGLTIIPWGPGYVRNKPPR